MNKAQLIVDKKISDYKIEVEKAIKEMEEQQLIVKQLMSKNNKDLTESHKLFIIRDKLTFFKACVLCLTDLKQSLEE